MDEKSLRRNERYGIMLTDKDVAIIEAVLQKGHRVELIPVRDGVKIMRLKRDELNKSQS